jgi:hypothetical protein
MVCYINAAVHISIKKKEQAGTIYNAIATAITHNSTVTEYRIGTCVSMYFYF